MEYDRILALDLGVTTGYCYKANTNRVRHGSVDLSNKRTESWAMRLVNFRVFVRDIIEEHEINCVVYETPYIHHKRPASAISGHNFEGTLLEMLEAAKIPYKGFSPKAIKVFAGNGKWNKKQMMKAAKEQMGYKGKDDNEADAMWLYQLAQHYFREGITLNN